MTWMLNIISILAFCALAFIIVRTLSTFDHKLNLFVSAHNDNIRAVNKKFDRINKEQELNEARRSNADDQIEEIINRLEAITADIARIDKAEKEIRSYYVNFREPAVSTGGVAWANEFVCGEETDE